MTSHELLGGVHRLGPAAYDRYLAYMFDPYAAELVLRIPDGSERVLELACGTGIVTKRLRADPAVHVADVGDRDHGEALTNRSAPPATVTPVLIYPDVRAAVEWLEGAFGFGERVRIGDRHRAQLRVGEDGSIVVADVRGEQVAPSAGAITHLIKVRVEDVDGAFARARDFGARVLEEPNTWEYGERSCVVEDLAGHRWELTQTVRDVEPEEWGGVSVAPW